MATLDIDFDFTAVEPSPSNFDLLPPGDYVVEIVDSSVRDTKAGTGKYVSLQAKVVDGEFENRRVYSNINYKNANPTAQQIGQNQLAELCSAVGLKKALTDTVDLHDTPIIAKVVVEKDKTGQYGDRNSIRGFKPLTNNAPAAISQAARPTVASAASKTPWAK